MGEHREVFVAFDVAKLKHAVAIAEGDRSGEVRFLGEIENKPAAIEQIIKKLASAMAGCTSASRPGRRAMGCAGRSGTSATTAWWSHRR